MFDFFRRSTAKELIQQANETYGMPVAPVVAPVASPPKRTAIAYKVGKTEDGRVTLSVGEYSDTTVTMTNAGVDNLIRMLEAAKEDEDFSEEQEAHE